jgi:hypothetical protein
MLPSVGLLPHVICSPPVFRSVDHDATCGSRAMNYQPPQSRIPTARRLTKHCSAGSILMRQRPARSGTLLDEAIRPDIRTVALYADDARIALPWPM